MVSTAPEKTAHACNTTRGRARLAMSGPSSGPSGSPSAQTTRPTSTALALSGPPRHSPNPQMNETHEHDHG